MAKNVYGSGLNNVGSYQVSGEPFLTASTILSGQEEKIEFPKVSNNVTVRLDNPNNCLFLSGAMAYQIENVVGTNGLASVTSSYSISYWFNNDVPATTSDITWGWGTDTGLDKNTSMGAMWYSFDNRFQLTFPGINFKWYFIAGSTGPDIYDGSWHHLAFTLKVDNTGRQLTGSLYFNGQPYTGNGAYTRTGTTTSPINHTLNGNGFYIGTTKSTRLNQRKYRDFILWDGVLTDVQALDLYQASGSYGNSAFNAANKVFWLKPEEAPQNPAPATLVNSGEIEGDFIFEETVLAANFYEISSDSPYTNSGSLRVHYRSTGSLPNVETNNHYWTLDSQNEQITMNVKSKEIYLSSDGGDVDYSLHADLTNIPTSRMYQHTGSGVDE